MSERAAKGAVAAGHPLTASAGIELLKLGGNAVDAALAAMFASFACEPLLTGLGAGGYMLIQRPGGQPELIDFSVSAPNSLHRHSPLKPVEVNFGDATQIFNIGASSCAVYGVPAGIQLAAQRYATAPLDQLVETGAKHAQNGVTLNRQQAYVVSILEGIVTESPECAAIYAPEGRLLREGQRLYNPELAETLRRFGSEGAKPFYSGDIAAAVVERLADEGGLITPEDLAAYTALKREPLTVNYRNSQFVTNPPPSAGGLLIAYALRLLEQRPERCGLKQLIEAMQLTQSERTAEFLSGLVNPEFVRRFKASKLGGTTHIAVIDAEGTACTVTCSNGEGSGVVVAGTGIHLNNMLGEEDLNPLGFFKHEVGRRLPSMMSPSLLLRDGAPWVAIGSAGSNRIRSAILQTVVNLVEGGLTLEQAIAAPRLHAEDGTLFIEPGIDTEALNEISQKHGLKINRFANRSLFFGGVQAVAYDHENGSYQAAGDPRRGGVGLLV